MFLRAEARIFNEGLNFKLDVGTLRLDQRVACQRYRQPITDAKTSFAKVKSTVAAIKQMNLTPSFATAELV